MCVLTFGDGTDVKSKGEEWAALISEMDVAMVSFHLCFIMCLLYSGQ